ncbi:MAG: hypothetical protein ABEJ36_01480 [Candidatus Nanosalina sp.]
MKASRAWVFFLAVSLMVHAAAAVSFGDARTEAVPNVEELEVFEVTGLSDQQMRTEGELVEQGLNETFSIAFQEYGVYRFEFRIQNDGGENWTIRQEDILKHSGLNSTWTLEEAFYNISSPKFGGNFTSGTIHWNTSLGGTLEVSGENSTMEAAYIVNITSKKTYTYQEKFLVNDTSNNAGSYDYHDLKAVKLGFLNVSLVRPPNDTILQRNKSFNITAEAECVNGRCGEVNISARYNETGSSANTLIPENSGLPFHTLEPNTRVCDGFLSRGEQCSENISTNATGSIDSSHLLDVNASSNYSEISINDSEGNEVTIESIVIMDLSWNTTRFGVADPGRQNVSAKGNDNLKYNITITEESNQADSLFVRATNLTSKVDPSYAIRPGNITLGFDQDSSGGFQLAYTFIEIMSDIDPGTVINTFYHLDVPTGMTAGDYNGSMIFKANSTS